LFIYEKNRYIRYYNISLNNDVMQVDNLISVTIKQEAISNIEEALETIKNNLPKLINLTDEEKKNLPRITDKSIIFIKKTLEYAEKYPALVPNYLNIQEFRKDVEAVEAFYRILKPIQILSEKLEDNAMLAGSEAYMASLAFYMNVKSAARMGVMGSRNIYDELRAKIPVKKKKRTPSA
jgi:hypothetical protein